jgi:hypothetical protein
LGDPRIWLIGALLAGCAIVFVACRPGALPTPSEPVDVEPPAAPTVTVVALDLAMPLPSPPAPAGETGCRGYGACYGVCNTTTKTTAQFDACTAACDARASTAAYSAVQNTFDCGVSACMQAGRCASLTDASDECMYCAYDAVSAMFGLPCSDDLLCNTHACAEDVSACLASTP